MDELRKALLAYEDYPNIDVYREWGQLIVKELGREKDDNMLRCFRMARKKRIEVTCDGNQRCNS